MAAVRIRVVDDPPVHVEAENVVAHGRRPTRLKLVLVPEIDTVVRGKL